MNPCNSYPMHAMSFNVHPKAPYLPLVASPVAWLCPHPFYPIPRQLLLRITLHNSLLALNISRLGEPPFHDPSSSLLVPGLLPLCSTNPYPTNPDPTQLSRSLPTPENHITSHQNNHASNPSHTDAGPHPHGRCELELCFVCGGRGSSRVSP